MVSMPFTVNTGVAERVARTVIDPDDGLDTKFFDLKSLVALMVRESPGISVGLVPNWITTSESEFHLHLALVPRRASVAVSNNSAQVVSALVMLARFVF
mmetsp:Transcript_58407/g.137136  ORF Transcript_58407/g.137136 Transcript_58407/m.137136 type:complete len:99 (-) Transcript_58407:7558-7854(-)